VQAVEANGQSIILRCLWSEAFLSFSLDRLSVLTKTFNGRISLKHSNTFFTPLAPQFWTKKQTAEPNVVKLIDTQTLIHFFISFGNIAKFDHL
jgi:hypothetical protein